MGATHFHKIIKDNDLPCEVEYEIVSYGEDNYDHPGHICDGGGSGPEVSIRDSWPDTPDFMILESKRLALVTALDSPMHASKPWIVQAWGRLKLIVFVLRIDWKKRAARLTDDERWRWEAVICEEIASNPRDYDGLDDWYDLER